MVTPDKLTLTTRDDRVAVVPYLVGFTPTDSLVVVVLDGRQVRFAARLDLPHPSDLAELAAPAAQNAAMIARHGSAAFLVGYGPADRVAPAATLLTTALTTAGVDVLEALRVGDGRYWCLCGDTGCADGVAYDPAGSRIAAEAVYRGLAPLPDRAALERLITPISGAERDRMRATTTTALHRLTGMLADETSATAGTATEHVVRAGVAAVQQAYESAARGEALSDDEVAWLTAVLMVPEVRDHAWISCDGSDGQRRLWIDVTRRAMPATSAAPACLLAITAYLAGDGALANIAVTRALHADPDYHLAHLLGHALQAGVSPQQWRAATTDTTAE
ncbi:DUF4192 domain-containing protein [Micromonospora sediminimaris]|uniref:DUF4192 domain-containing protein n=1 Tax=Micromonospora sediminimaris TaxID=547162 RepID=A0A9W5USZ4_9ACTN|nr:DUF4192 domain-containing protein [Micromonospora sediminimaris]GIJ35002.1 hypothetical protein Vse01_41500 [Micromonospora sediminimaris]SFD28597.1 protein of unknown function [Micromonospora sediminimaris]